MNQFPPSPRVFHKDRFRSLRFATGVVSHYLPPVSTTQGEQVAKMPPVSLIPVANLQLVPLIPAANLPTVSLTPVVHLDLRISPRIFEKIRNDPNVIIRDLGEGDSRKKPEAKNLVTLSL
jgi:hypothetical protein